MAEAWLIAHPDAPPPPGVRVHVQWAPGEQATLALDFAIDDPSRCVRWPADATGRTDGLWRHSCFEAFVGSGNGSAYAEFNLSPSGAWAAYAFDGYRAGMRDLVLSREPAIVRPQPGRWAAVLDLTGLAALIGTGPWRLGLSAVIEAQDGGKSYWALCHPPGGPDFHHADCFAARLD